MIKVGLASHKGILHLREQGIMPLNFQYDQDTIVVASFKDRPISIMLARPMIWIHGLHTCHDFTDRFKARATEAMLNYALGWGPAAPRLACGSLFQIAQGNDRMEAIANSLGGVEEPESRVFRLDL